MKKLYTSLGLMSGTSGDGIDISLIRSDGLEKCEFIFNKYFTFTDELYEKFHILKDLVKNSSDIERNKNLINEFERIFTLENAKAIKEIQKNTNEKIDVIGFHGQTIYHNSKEKISLQLGNGNLLSNLTNTKVVYNFRKNDLLNGGQGAPLTPIFHYLLSKKIGIKNSLFLNIGGISNVTLILKNNSFFATDIGPGMCLIDKWIRKNLKKKYDNNGSIASKGKVRNNLDYELDTFLHFENKEFNKNYIKSFSVDDFDISFVRGLSLEDGAATLSEYTAQIIANYYFYILNKYQKENISPILLFCGGGRKNKDLIKRIKKNLDKIVKVKPNLIQMIDDYGVDGDYIESQAFAYLAIRSLLELPISFPNTTGCNFPLSGGVVSK